ncbi:hypothetical protein NP493_1719g00026 [Ridgeia piscesae]|uniref:N-acetylneuraminate lyase n=1 Tax=Ridgeia piscesae TaxID=27915 RepID=A0AAD9JUJ0_RIDPI|nr:hypothetical protein NP493_1719g00026 [Ridgeia piscesae]
MSASKSVADFVVRGLVDPPVTPFSPTGDRDEGRRNADDTGREEASGRGVGEGGQGQATHAQTAGADAIACVGPTFFKPDSLETYVSYMKEVAAAAPELPFYLYDNDVITGITYAAADFFRAAKDVIPTLRGVKHTTPSVRNITDVLAEFGNRYQAVADRDSLSLIFWSLVIGETKDCVLQMFLACLALGVDTGVMYGYNGHVLNRLKAAFEKGDMETARLEQQNWRHKGYAEDSWTGQWSATTAHDSNTTAQS